MDSTRIITIDGPAASGKSTLAKKLAQKIGWSFLDTGLLYRALAFAAQRAGLLEKGPEELGRFACQLKIKVLLEKDRNRVFLDGEELTDLLRTPMISRAASQVSAVGQVRSSLRELQKTLGERGNLVTEGRDQGSAIFPKARLKFYLTASPEARAQRRYLELGKDSGPLSAILQSVLERDHQDSTRADDPLVIPAGAVKVDSTDKSLESVFEFMLQKAISVFGVICK
ncbi:MAG: (d)CMP kinase [Deltaproteobacteria bacterium]|jgi:cytidylate kinase|nr:(d)CMP kinase [Deltaproteobacteria bacterium]